MLYDAHCHLDFPVFDTDREEVLQRAKLAGVNKIVLAGISAATWPRLLALLEKFPTAANFSKSLSKNPPKHLPQLYACLGLHPLFIDQHQPEDLVQLKKLLLANPQVIALGEIGIDLHSPELQAQEAKQWQFFDAQLKLAKELELPVVIHVRQAMDQVIQRLRQVQLPQAGLLHAFSGSQQQAEQLFDLGYKLGLGGGLTYPRANKLRKVAKNLPLNAFLLETDSPDMPLKGYQGQRNEPARVKQVLKVLADLRATRTEAILPSLHANLLDVFPKLKE
ncbi:TatD family hydrolase [Marinospirillum insulare]|uniref:Metal-dependent hydrolase n=1 Tax=Marinospirillum insulare TaxID=217169 RepID=A0ABQ5ZSZ4_9GAMM|nr:TatD family hydrolase [Marinospirillum insulare]GLR63094.1 metal-dependent hydrolase [Marinospirillum insulare]